MLTKLTKIEVKFLSVIHLPLQKSTFRKQLNYDLLKMIVPTAGKFNSN